ncbi:MAG TPA: chromosomal replication initiator protein DnaA, partial [Alphaproteobacteria bacterium]|nr:chromosomal replication initiator protein DnaA [Alphaproteobacteria bacterium]
MTNGVDDPRWELVKANLRAKIGEAAYQSWIKPIALREIANGQVRISVPTRFMRDWVVAHYADSLSELWKQEDAGIHAVDIFIQPEHSQQAPQPPRHAV